MHWLREKPGHGRDWPSDVQERMEALVSLGESRRAALRPRQGPDAREVLATRALLIGFPGAERRRMVALFEDSPDCRFLVRAAETVEHARSLTSEGGFDVALLKLLPAEESGASQLARVEVATNGIPILAVVKGEHAETLGDLGVHDVLVMDDLDPKMLSSEVERSIGRRHAAEALQSQDGEGFASARDVTTGLPEGAAIGEHLERALSYAERNREQVAVLLLDVDRFEAFERRLGREAAEGLMITTADRLRGALRKSDVIARVEDGDFLALLQGRDLDYAPARAAERMLESFSRPIVVQGEEHDMTASIGIALYPRDATDPVDLLRLARFALETARAAGRNCYRFYGHTESASEARRHVVAERIRGALGRGDLRVHYQPRVDGRDGTIVGAEALLRWTDEKLGEVSPGEFVPIAERTGQMCEIGDWVMREACLAHARWRAAGFSDLCLSVNVSAHQVQSASLRDAVVGAVMETKIPPNRLEIELTETALVDNQNTAAQLLRELAEIGVTLSLDDFGTGHSALSYVRTFPVRTLKIDPSFVREIQEGQGCPSFVNGILALARTLALDVVAEGVETEPQRAALLAEGCHEMQGFLFSPGVSEEALLALLHAGPLLPAD
jgi:diguanylate cyclase (GGDEF)-like protein